MEADLVTQEPNKITSIGDLQAYLISISDEDTVNKVWKELIHTQLYKLCQNPDMDLYGETIKVFKKNYVK